MAIATTEKTIVSAQVSADVRHELERLAALEDRSLSSLLRRAIAEHLARAHPEGEPVFLERASRS